MVKETTLNIRGDEYKAIITYKNIYSIRYRFVDGVFYINCPFSVSLNYLEELLSKKNDRRIFNVLEEKPYSEDYCYLFGEKQNIVDGFITFNNHYLLYNKDNLYKDIEKIATIYFKERVDYFSKLMGVSINHGVSTKLVRSQYGCNYYASKKITFNIYLIHFNKDIIDTVVIHELAHDFERNHGKKFYKIVYKYCPNYKKLHKALKLNKYNGVI